MGDFTIKDFLDVGVAGVLAFLLLKQRADYNALVTRLGELVTLCSQVIEANKGAIERLDNQRLLELTEAVKEIRRVDQARQRKTASATVEEHS